MSLSGESWPWKRSRCESQTAQPVPANKKDILHIRRFADTLMRANKGSAMQIRGRRKAAPRMGSTGLSQPSHWIVTACSWGTPPGAPRDHGWILHEAEMLLLRAELWGLALPDPPQQP